MKFLKHVDDIQLQNYSKTKTNVQEEKTRCDTSSYPLYPDLDAEAVVVLIW